MLPCNSIDVIIQGPATQSRIDEIAGSLHHPAINNIIYSNCSGTEIKSDIVSIVTHDDPGENIGSYHKPLNINRYLSININRYKYINLIYYNLIQFIYKSKFIIYF